MNRSFRRILLATLAMACLALPLACQNNFTQTRLSPNTPVGVWASPTPTYTLGPGCPFPVYRDVTGNLNGAPVTGNTCDNPNRFLDTGYGVFAPDELFLFQVDVFSKVTASVCGGAAWDTAMYLRTACDQSSSTIVRDDDGCGTRESRLSADLLPGTYYLILDGFLNSSECGAYSLNLRRDPMTPTPTPTFPPTPTATPTPT